MTDEMPPCPLRGCGNPIQDEHWLVSMCRTRGTGYVVYKHWHRGEARVQQLRRYFGEDGDAAVVFARNRPREGRKTRLAPLPAPFDDSGNQSPSGSE